MKLRLLTLFLWLFVSLFTGQSLLASNGTPPLKKLLQPDHRLKRSFAFKEDSMAMMQQSLLEVPIQKRTDGFVFPDIDAELISHMEEAPSATNNLGDNMTDLLLKFGDGSYSDKVKKAKQVIEKAIEIGNFLTTLTGENLEKATLPIVIKKTIGNITSYMVINKITLKPQYAELEVYVGMRVPSKNSSIVSQVDIKGISGDGLILMFAADRVKFSAEAGIIGDATIGLLSTVAFEVGGANKKTAIVLRPWHKHETPPSDAEDPNNYGTFITIDCDGVKEFGVEADFFFSRSWVLPTDEWGNILPEVDPQTSKKNRVHAHIAITVQDWNNMLFEGITITHFTLTKFQDVSFYVGNANIDLSDFSNPRTLTFPEGYESGFPPDNPELWRGVYIEKVEITLPDPFKRRCDAYGGQTDLQTEELCRIKVDAEKLLIDETGVTGSFGIEGEAPLLSGGLMNNAWSWSLDRVGMEVWQSEMTAFEFDGVIAVPIMKETKPLHYDAYINFDNSTDGVDYAYKFNVTLGEETEFPLWNAGEVVLAGGSAIYVTGAIEDGKVIEFIPEAYLSGKLKIGKAADYLNDPDGSEVKVPELTFQGLILKTEPSYISLDPNYGLISYSAGNSKVFNFPVNLNEFGLALTNGGTNVALTMQIGLNLMYQTDGGLSATGGFSIVGKLVETGSGAHRWEYDRLVFDGAHVALNLPRFKAEGTINIYRDHDPYGDGFSGVLCARILSNNQGTSACADNSGSIKVDVAAMFGSKTDYRYFLVDAYVSGSAIKVPLPPTPIVLNGFGGGASYHMIPTGYKDPEDGEALGEGVDASGIIYEPTPLTKLGLKFVVGLTTTGNTLQGKLTCLIRFGQNMSLQNITFWGVADFVKGVPAGADKTYPDVGDRVSSVADSEAEMHEADAQKAQSAQDIARGKVGLSMDFEHGFVFHGYADVFINMSSAGFTGKGTLDLLIDPNANKWHIFVGGYRDGSVQVPTFWNPEASVSLYPVEVGFKYWGIEVAIDAYFLTGNDIPGPPPIHPEAAAYFGEQTSSNRNMLNGSACSGSTAALGTGLAFGLGMEFKFNKKNQRKIFGLRITVYDIRIRGMFGADVSLLKYSESSQCQEGQPSDGPHGIKGFRATGRVWAFVDASGKVLGVPIPNIGLGVKLEADVFNPSYFDAVVVINFIKKWRFGVDIGKKCGVPCD